MEDSMISLTASDVFQQNAPHIAKPPVDFDYDHDDDDGDIPQRPTSPPREHYKTRPAEKGKGAAKQDMADGVGNIDGGVNEKTPPSQTCSARGARVMSEDNGVGVIPYERILDTNVVLDTGGKAAVGNGRAYDERVTDGEGRKERNVNEATGGQDATDGNDQETQGDTRGSGSRSWVVLNKEEEKFTDEIGDEDLPKEGVTELVDRIEAELDDISKGQRDVFDSQLFAYLRKLLPTVLFINDDLKTLQGRVAKLLLAKRSSDKENLILRHELAKRVDVEKVSVGITALIHDSTVEKSEKRPDVEQAKKPEVDVKQGEAGPAEREKTVEEMEKKLDVLKRENRKLSHQCKELLQVNHSWERFSEKQERRNDAGMKKLTTQLEGAENRNKQLAKRLDTKFKEYDQTLLHAKAMERQQRVVSEQYKKDRDALRLKYEDAKEKLRDAVRMHQEKDAEIRRLNEAGVRPRDIKIYKLVKKPSSPSDRDQVAEDRAEPARKHRGEKAAERSPVVAKPAAEVVAPPKAQQREKHAAEPRDPTRQPRERSTSPPHSPRGPPSPRRAPGHVKESNNRQMSLTTAELKDQVILYREQMDAYRSDFNQERRDREKAIGQVDSLKKELDQTKQRLKEIQKNRKRDMQAEHDYYAAARMNFLPEDTQEMRLREFEQTRGRRIPAHGRENAADNFIFVDNIYADIE